MIQTIKIQGVNFLDNEDEIIKNSEIVIQLGLPDEEKLSLFKENQTLIGSLNAFEQEKFENLKSKNKLFLIRVLQE